MTDAVRQAVDRLTEVLRCHQIDPALPFLDRLARLPKKVIYRASYEAFVAELPRLAAPFLKCLELGEPKTTSGRALVDCVRDQRSNVETPSGYEFVELFLFQYLKRSYHDTQHHARFWLFRDAMVEPSAEFGELLNLVRSYWLLDPRQRWAPDNVNPDVYSGLDPLRVWAFWTRGFTHPIHLDDEAGNRIAKGFVYDLRSAVGFEPPVGDVSATIRGLLQEADLLRIGSIPPTAFVEINVPPFVCLVLCEIGSEFVAVEALDSHDRALPIHLFPSVCGWTIPNTGCGPRDPIASFKEIANVIAVIAAAALRDFWVVEDREHVLGQPRLARIAGSTNKTKRVIYLPRIRYVGASNLSDRAQSAANISARAAHWRTDHYRKLPEGQTATKEQMAIARAFGRSPAPGTTWVRSTTVAGLDVERVYRSRSISRLIFDMLPSKGQALTDLSWFDFERFCGRWLGDHGFEEVARAAIDKGVDITAFTGSTEKPIQWVVQCKHWKAKVGPDVVRELEGARKLRDSDRAMLVTSSAFTRAAIETSSDLEHHACRWRSAPSEVWISLCLGAGTKTWRAI
jgi:HJR/Mrr/RecB family endonuclease